jgi:small subunit ribosomal protein S16
MGTKGKPFYRVVVANSTSPRDGRFIETIGHLDPRADPPAIVLNVERARYWLSCGAQPSDTARAILKKQGVVQGAEAPPPPAAAEMPPQPAAEAPPAAEQG